jgi:hypothetical protein
MTSVNVKVSAMGSGSEMPVDSISQGVEAPLLRGCCEAFH